MRWYLIVFATVTVWAAIAGVGWCAEAGSQPTLEIAGLIDHLGDEHSQQAAVSRLGKIGPSAIPALSSVLDRKDDVQAKRAAIRTLLQIATPESASAIKKGLKDSDPRVRGRAMASLKNLAFSPKRAIEKMECWESIRPCILDKNSDVRIWAAWDLQWLNEAKTVPLLLDALDREIRIPRENRGKDLQRDNLPAEPCDANIITLAGCLSSVTDWSCLPTIEAYIGKGNKDMDYCLAYILASHKGAHIFKELLIDGATKCSIPSARAHIVRELWQVDDPRVDDILKKALEDPYSYTSKGNGFTYSMRASAERGKKFLEIRRQGRDPLAEEAAAFLKNIQEQQKGSTEQKATPPPTGGQKQ